MDRDRIASALRASRADYTEIRLETQQVTCVVYQGERLETVATTRDEGGIVRALVRGGGWGISTFNRLDDLERRVEQATESARLIQAEPISLAPVAFREDAIHAELATDFRQVPLAQKKELIEGYNGIILSCGPIVDTEASYVDEFSTVTYANSEGAYITEERPMVDVCLVATAREGSNVQQAMEWFSAPAGYEQVLGLHDLARKVGERAVSLLSAQTVVGGVYPVVCNPLLGGLFVHEAFGHLSEADFLYANPQAQQMMVLGRRFGRDHLTIVDDGSLPGLRGTHRYDDEGTPTRRTELVREGLLVGRLHSRETAARMGESPTGNARAESYRYAPLVRMTNTFIEPRDATFQDMISEIKLGVYACDVMGGETDLGNFSFSAGYGYMIRAGRIAELVKDVVLAGNLFTTLQSIDAIGRDLEFSKGGKCSKGQRVNVSGGAPHIRIQDVMMGGR